MILLRMIFLTLRKKHCDQLLDYIVRIINLNLNIEYGCEISFQIDWDRFSHITKNVLLKDKYLLVGIF